MASVTQVVTLILAVVGTVVSVIALVVNRKNAREATEAKTRVDSQSLAHQELVDSLAATSGLVEQYRKQVDETRQEMSRASRRHEQQIAAVHRDLSGVKKEHRLCRDDLSRMESQMRIAEARIAELGG